MSTNPLKEVLTGEQFQRLVNFYEADQKLDHNDRLAIAGQLQAIAIKSNLAGYTAGMLGFFGPSLYFRIAKKPVPNPFFLIQYPFLSLCVGFGTLIIGNNVTARYLYNKVKNDRKDAPNANVANAWDHMDYGNLSAFTLYYSRTAFNPMFIIRDPRQASNASYIDDKLKQKSNLHFTEGVGLGQHDSEGGKHELGVWDKLRLHHGLDVSTPKQN
ncbi:hypothetical protein PVL30_004735 [Lodderomyces elongisporus]|uniref:uncharacterized protein n=1 Tax=Lodderomyces elongisporus TaxID=36914 RepID=UPI002923A49A|nr:uncharacterized protein PVL30_004735 [Lodderomyces elongisporus]WLF80941.1 hypothetical protein PVL30_004735 [Lodderomyces elongisporus]